MALSMTIIERAYDLARSSNCQSVPEIAAVLKRENFASVDAHLQGNLIKKDLRALIARRSTAG